MGCDAQLTAGRSVCGECPGVNCPAWEMTGEIVHGGIFKRSVTHDFLRYINILTYLLTYLLKEGDFQKLSTGKYVRGAIIRERV